jgi:hypothetical protein
VLLVQLANQSVLVALAPVVTSRGQPRRHARPPDANTVTDTLTSRSSA